MAILKEHPAILALLRNNGAHDIEDKDIPLAVASFGTGAAMELLLRDPSLTVAEDMVTAAADNEDSGAEVMELLLQTDTSRTITEGVVTAAAGIYGSGTQVMKLLLQREPNLTMSNGVLIFAAGNTRCGNEVMELLLRSGANLTITERVVTAAAGDPYSSKDLMVLVLQKNSNTVTEGAILQIAEHIDEIVMGLLLQRHSTFAITEGVVAAAARNRGHGKEVMELLLQKAPNLTITNGAVAKIAEHFDETLLEPLLRSNTSERIQSVELAAEGHQQRLPPGAEV